MAVVDMVSVFNSLDEKETIEVALKDLVYSIQFKEKSWRSRVNNMMADLRLLEEGSPVYQRKMLEIERARWRPVHPARPAKQCAEVGIMIGPKLPVQGHRPQPPQRATIAPDKGNGDIDAAIEIAAR